MKKLLLTWLFFTAFLQAQTPGHSQLAQSAHVEAQLISQSSTAVPGQAFWLVLQMTMEPHWHTYTEEPGDSGLPTEIEWQLPPGWQHSPIHWPAAKTFDENGLVSYGYEGTVALPVQITPPPDATIGETVTLTATASWLACKEACIPGEAELSLTLTIANASQAVASFPPQALDFISASTVTQPTPSPDSSASLTSDTAEPPSTYSLYTALALAFIGGIILNLMPCVFPVLGIKILGFSQQSGNSSKQIKLHGLIFSLGVLVSFWALTAVLLALRAGGDQLGWGFQLQNPLFTAFLAFVFFLFALNLLGVFELGNSLTGAGSKLQNKEGLSGSFFSGIFVTLVATPCTGPFMGPALGYALSQPSHQAFLIFTSLALGLALPYLVLSFVPAWIQALPRPGPWMETLRQFLAFPMFASALWLLSVFQKQTSASALTLTLFCLLLVALGTWIYGKNSSPAASAFRKKMGALVAGLCLLIAGYGIWEASADIQHGTPLVQEKYGLMWEPFSFERIAELRSMGSAVYVDFTATWCQQCLTNKFVVFKGPGSEKVIQLFQEKGVIPMIADWTKRDPAITEALATFDRAGIPFNVVYPADPSQEAIILPNVLTPAIVIDALNNASP